MATEATPEPSTCVFLPIQASEVPLQDPGWHVLHDRSEAFRAEVYYMTDNLKTSPVYLKVTSYWITSWFKYSSWDLWMGVADRKGFM